MILLRDATSNEPAGLAFVNWWGRFGRGELSDSVREFGQRVEPMQEMLQRAA